MQKVPNGFFYKVILVLLVAALALSTLDFLIIKGGLFSKRVGVKPVRARFAAEISEKNTELLPNLKATSLIVRSKSNDDRFRVGDQIEVSCTLSNNSAIPLNSFRSLIRTPNEELMSVHTKKLAANENVTLDALLTPQNSGVFIIACRGDIDKNIKESKETDNREVATIYVVE